MRQVPPCNPSVRIDSKSWAFQMPIFPPSFRNEGLVGECKQIKMVCLGLHFPV